ncbi:MAG: hypothetical protein U0L58_09295, partial [Ruminococcus sp.]|nr:hypothetical protein [Ruminococcus sp.]
AFLLFDSIRCLSAHICAFPYLDYIVIFLFVQYLFFKQGLISAAKKNTAKTPPCFIKAAKYAVKVLKFSKGFPSAAFRCSATAAERSRCIT